MRRGATTDEGSTQAKVSLVTHSYDDPGCYEEIEAIGIFSSVQTATDFVDDRRAKSGFVDHPEAFHITPFKVDEDVDWTGGFVTD